MSLPAFAECRPFALGIELELQIVNRHDYDLAPQAPDLLRALQRSALPGRFAGRSTRFSVELATEICSGHAEALAHLRELRDALCQAADRIDVGICGGGTHLFNARPAVPRGPGPPPRTLAQLWPELGRQSALFGQHVHIGCPGPDQALVLMQGLGRFVPHLIALAASSPYEGGVNGGFDSLRQRTLSAFPLVGRAPFVLRWSEFEADFDRKALTGVVEGLDDVHWDLCPQPATGAIELRVLDAPLTVEKAAALAAYVQCLARWLRIERPFDKLLEPGAFDDVVYVFNRFQACRLGLDATFVDPSTHERRTLRDDVKASFDALELHAMELRAEDAIRFLRFELAEGGNDAAWIRNGVAREGLLAEVVRQQCVRFEGGVP
ncbi:MAG: glutamate--cysteine ligase [Burkholderiales bacterium]|nr:MAG: glutamate--cysteine ligase [Burkholderiales bacterium]